MEYELLWIGVFNIFVIVMLLIDLLIFNREAHEITIKEALLWSGVWIALAMLFNIGVFYYLGKVRAFEFLTGYIIEKSLSIDNLFVFLLIFSYFKVPPKYQHKVLFWGIIGALIMRAILIFFGIILINTFHWIIFLFGAFLVYTGIKMGFQKEEKEIRPEKNLVVRIFKSFISVTPRFEEGNFFTKEEKKRKATLLFVVLIVVETTDLVFAVDSIPAILAITTDPFIVYTSNVFAILGLRALYFALAGIMELFYYLKYGLAFVLVFIGAKMLFSDYYKIPIGFALSVVATILIVSIVVSLIKPQKNKT
jgi:tellurite resistance protein TerC